MEYDHNDQIRQSKLNPRNPDLKRDQSLYITKYQRKGSKYTKPRYSDCIFLHILIRHRIQFGFFSIDNFQNDLIRKADNTLSVP